MHKRTGLVGHNSGIKGLPYKIMGCAAWGEGKPAPGRGLGAGQADRASATGKQRKDSTFGVRMLNPGPPQLGVLCRPSPIWPQNPLFSLSFRYLAAPIPA
jgi:hypothetical protein